MAPVEFDIEAIRELAKVLEETNTDEIKIANGDAKITVRRNAPQAVSVATMPQMAAPAPMMQTAAPAAASVAAPAAEDLSNAVRSPMVGTAYLKPDPESPSYISEGDSVTEGDTLMIIEAMKVMNPIKAPRSGTILKIMAQNGQPVEFDEALVILS